MPGRKKESKAKKNSSGKKMPAKEKKKPAKIENTFPVVGIRASAGGLEDFEKFFNNVPADSGMAFIVVTYLDPTHVSLMPDLMQRCTALKIVQVKEGMKVEQDNVYVIPPDKDMGIMNGTLLLAKPKLDTGGPKAPINYFLRSLAEDMGERAPCLGVKCESSRIPARERT